MPRNPSGNPKTYDEIVRATVVDPDSSVRPTREQEQAAKAGYRALDADEQVLHERVQHALVSSGADVSAVTVEVTGELVTLRGRVLDSAMLQVLEDTVAHVTGVDTIHNQVVVG